LSSTEEQETIQGMAEMQRLVAILRNEIESSWDFGTIENVPSFVVVIDKFSEKLETCWVAYENILKWQELNPQITISDISNSLELLETLDLHVVQLKEKLRNIIYQDKQNKKINQDSIFIAVVDTETTGLAEEDEVISIGIVLLEISAKSGKLIREIDSYYGLREPTVPIHPMAKKVHGLNLNDLNGKQLDIVRLEAMFEQVDIFAAHNAQFDYKMLIKIFPELAYATWGCTCLGLRDFWRNMPNRKLDTICATLGVSRLEPHNAMSDCRALIEVLVKSKSDYATGTPYMWNLVNRPWMPYPD
jgi:DNA polymerase III epsilon subunit-like protein